MNRRILTGMICTLVASEVLILQLASVDQVKGQTTRTGKKPVAKNTTQAKPSPVTAIDQDENKTPFVSEDGRFSVVLPSGFPALKRTEETAATPQGEVITVATFQSDLKTKNSVNHCVIAYTDYPTRIFDELTPTRLIETARKNILAGLPGVQIIKDELFDWHPDTGLRVPTNAVNSLIFERSMPKTLGLPGRSTFFSVRDGSGVHYARSDIFLDKPRICSILLAYDNKSAFDTQAVKNFFESFHLVAEKK